MTVSFKDQVAIVTGAGNGLGRSHALALAKRGAKLVVNDLGGASDGSGTSSAAAKMVVDEIIANGGDAIASTANVTDFDEVEIMVADAMAKWGRVDVLINNAGIIRDKSFANMDIADFKSVIDVHLMGSVNCTKAVWEIMREQNYGRILMTTSSSGLYGNFGQSNYGAAKMALVGLMHTLAIEGAKHDIRVNALAPVASTRMTETLMPNEMQKIFSPESVTPAALLLAGKDAPNRMILCAGAGVYSQAQIVESEGIYLKPVEQSPEEILNQWQALTDTTNQQTFETGPRQLEKVLQKQIF